MQYHKRKSDQTGLKLSYRGQDLPRRSSREVVMLIAQLPARGHWSNPAPLSLDAAPLSRNPSPDGPEETKLPPAEDKTTCAHGSERGWRPLRAAREERAAPRSQTSEGSPRSSSAVSARTGSPNWNRAKNLHDTAQHTAREQLIKNHTEWKEHKHKLCNWRHISIKNYQHFRKQLKIYMALSLVMSSETQQKSQYTKCFKLN